MLSVTDLPYDPFTASQITASRKSLDVAVRDGVVRRVLRGVYVRADLTDTIELRARAAGLVLSPHAVVVDRTAAWLHGVDVLGWQETEILPPVESFVLRGHARARRAGVFGGTRDLLPGDVTRIAGTAVTTPLRTAMDLACLLPPSDGLAALDAFLHQGSFLRQDLRLLLPRYHRRRGVVQARWLCAHAAAAAESPGESWTRFEILRQGLPAPVLQHVVEVGGLPRYRLDLAYPRHRVAIEYDGADHHTSAVDRLRDLRRRAHLEELGWIVIVVDRSTLTPDEVDRWIREIRAALASRRSRTARSTASN